MLSSICSSSSQSGTRCCIASSIATRGLGTTMLFSSTYKMYIRDWLEEGGGGGGVACGWAC